MTSSPQSPYQDPLKSASVGTRLLFENERVRVWDLALEPGETLPLHRHELDYLYVVIGGGTLQTGFADGTADEPRLMKDGEVRFREVTSPDGQPRATHSATNVGETPWRNIVVELKKAKYLAFAHIPTGDEVFSPTGCRKKSGNSL